MKPLFAALTVALLTACGVDGAPQPPATPGVSISGSVNVGVARAGDEGRQSDPIVP